jgi:hypothetical protein
VNPLLLLASIVQSELALEDDQVYLWDQKIDIPPDSRLYVALAMVSCKPFSNDRSMRGDSKGLYEDQSTNFQATVQLDIFSRSTEARDRKEEVVMAFNSTLSQQTQEANGFYIAPVPSSFNNLSQIEGAAIPYRFTISVAIQYKVTKTKAVPYFGTFPTSPPLLDP